MKTQLTFLLSLTFLFLFSGSVYGDEPVDKQYWDMDALPLAEQHCSKFDRTAKFSKMEGNGAIFDCVD
jgi:hypothetical protein